MTWPGLTPFKILPSRVANSLPLIISKVGVPVNPSGKVADKEIVWSWATLELLATQIILFVSFDSLWIIVPSSVKSIDTVFL